MDKSPPVADLHLHTITSDGRLTIDVLPDAARVGEVDTVAVTDHDHYHPELDAPVVERDDVIVVRGVELRVDAGDRQVDPLGYGLGERSALVKTVERLRRSRVERAREVVAAIGEKTGVHLGIDIHDGVGRPHVVRAIDASEIPYDHQDMFDEPIGTDGPCYVAHELPMSDDGVVALRDACDVVSLAHPFRYRDSAGALKLCADLDAVKRYCPYGFDVEANLIEEAVERYGLFTTGGGGAHGETLGRVGPSETNFAQFAAVVDDF